MNHFPPTIIYRHRKENLKKCSLRGLEKRSDFLFYTYPQARLPDLRGTILLSMEGEPLSEQDKEAQLLLIDGTWNYAEVMHRQLEKQFPEGIVKRSLPGNWETAYPRKQTKCPDPERGLATIEALYAAYVAMGRPTDDLLDHYHWKELFLQKNA
jgi:pre-rRNA-processing protein TSR3